MHFRRQNLSYLPLLMPFFSCLQLKPYDVCLLPILVALTLCLCRLVCPVPSSPVVCPYRPVLTGWYLLPSSPFHLRLHFCWLVGSGSFISVVYCIWLWPGGNHAADYSIMSYNHPRLLKRHSQKNHTFIMSWKLYHWIYRLQILLLSFWLGCSSFFND